MSLYCKMDKDKNVIPAKDCMDWATAFEHDIDGRTVKQETLGKYRISTMFFGTNMNCFDQGTPLVFETMIFDGDESIYCKRYPTWDEAVKGHQVAVRKLNEKIKREKNEVQK